MQGAHQVAQRLIRRGFSFGNNILLPSLVLKVKFGALNSVIAGTLAVSSGLFLWAADEDSSIFLFLVCISCGLGFR